MTGVFRCAKSDIAALSFCDEAVPGLSMDGDFMFAKERFCGLCSRCEDANAFIIVWRGIASTDRAFLQWLWKAREARVGNTGDDGTEAESLPTVVAAENVVDGSVDDSERSLSGKLVSMAFKEPN